MNRAPWQVSFKVYRNKGSEAPHFETFKVEIDPDEYVLDGVERIWAFQDRSLVFRHLCHHSTCGACGMRVNGVEKLTCITPVHKITRNGGSIKLEPLRNFPVVSDLAVDMGFFYGQMERVGQMTIHANQTEAVQPEARPAGPAGEGIWRLSDCIECGLCVSACPISASSAGYLGPAALAGAHQHGLCGADRDLLPLVDGEDGVWRCHSAFECSQVCPSFVDPGWRIMDLRRKIIAERVRRFFGGQPQPAGISAEVSHE